MMNDVGALQVRKTEDRDIPHVIDIYSGARALLRRRGIPQWTRGNYPNEDTLRDDINAGWAFVVQYGNAVAATAAIMTEQEPNYQIIRNGAWLHDGKYATVHRIAVHSDYLGHGLARALFAYAEEVAWQLDFGSVRVDTHEQNTPMRRLVASLGFQQCGIVTVEDGTLRVAYEKLLEPFVSTP